MIFAAIDVGSNTIRMLIGTFHDNEFSRILTGQKITRLAQGIRETGSLAKGNMERSLSVMKDFSKTMARHGASYVRAVGTSALRDAQNSGEFINMVLHETGIQIDVISGTEEAMLTARGVLCGFKNLTGSYLIIDIGGGSTEWIIQNEEDPSGNLLCGTLPIGVVNLHENFIKTDPPAKEDITALTDSINALFISGIRGVVNSFTGIDRLIGTGGTITTLAAIDLGLREYDHEMVHGHCMPFQRLNELKSKLLCLSLKERKNIAGVEPERADLIIPGILLTIRLLEFFGFREITVSDFGLLEGIIKGASDEKSF